LICDRFPFRPLCRQYAPAQFGEFRFRNIQIKRTDCVGLFANRGYSRPVGSYNSTEMIAVAMATIGASSICFLIFIFMLGARAGLTPIKTVDVHHSLGKGLRCFLRQIVTDASLDIGR
jgi:hypothetical protein